MERVRRGMSLEEVRRIWISRADTRTKAIFDAYRERRGRVGGYGHEGLGVYGIYQKRAARERMRLAVKLLEQAGFEVTPANIRKLTSRSASASTIKDCRSRRQPAPSDAPPDETPKEEEPPHIIRFPGRP